MGDIDGVNRRGVREAGRDWELRRKQCPERTGAERVGERAVRFEVNLKVKGALKLGSSARKAFGHRGLEPR